MENNTLAGYIITIDGGTTNTRCILWDQSRNKIAEEKRQVGVLSLIHILPVAAVSRQYYAAMRAHDMGQIDYSGLILLNEKICGIKS